MDIIKDLYIFYLFSDIFNPVGSFIEVNITDDNWGRYDVIQKEVYDDSSFGWIIQLMDQKQNPYDMDYDYIIYVPTKRDIVTFIEYINEYIIGQKSEVK